MIDSIRVAERVVDEMMEAKGIPAAILIAWTVHPNRMRVQERSIK